MATEPTVGFAKYWFTKLSNGTEVYNSFTQSKVSNNSINLQSGNIILKVEGTLDDATVSGEDLNPADKNLIFNLPTEIRNNDESTVLVTRSDFYIDADGYLCINFEVADESVSI